MIRVNQKMLIIVLRIIALILIILLAIALYGHYVARPGIRARLKRAATPMTVNDIQHLTDNQ